MTVTFMLKNGDVPMDSATGRPRLVDGKDKLRQDVRENLDTDVQVDGTGADLDGAIPLIGDQYSLRAEISRRITDSFAAYQSVQQKIQRNDRTPEESFARIVRIVVVPMNNKTAAVSKTDYAYRLDVASVRGVVGQPITVTGVITG